MSHTRAVIIGAGQAGLAVSRLLTAAAVDHVVLERGRVAERWHSQRWDSMRLLTPNWMTRLPGWSYRGSNPSGFMSAAQVAGFLGGYARSFDAPVLTEAAVRSVRHLASSYLVETDVGARTADAVVIATGFSDLHAVPAAAQALDPGIIQVTPDSYRNPAALPPGGVLVVGASATGSQLADELARAGRDVVLSVGRHTRLPRTYRGMDIMWWLDSMGLLDRPRSTKRPPRPENSLQLVGSADGREVDLPALAGRGVRLTGRFVDADGAVVRFADDLEPTVATAEQTMARFLERIDEHAVAAGLDTEIDRAAALPRLDLASGMHRTTRLDLNAAGIGSLVWATGYRRRYPWLHVPVLDARGEIIHTAGHTAAPGLSVIGQQWQTRRSSTLLDGVRHDAAIVAAQVINGRMPETLRRAS
jgi:putative flavoprotein involved in K+ transport